MLGGGGTARLRFGVLITRQRVGHVDGVQTFAWPAVRLEPPQGSLPQRGGVAVTVNKNNRWCFCQRQHPGRRGTACKKCHTTQQGQQGAARGLQNLHRGRKGCRKACCHWRLQRQVCTRLTFCHLPASCAVQQCGQTARTNPNPVKCGAAAADYYKFNSNLVNKYAGYSLVQPGF